MDAVTLAMVVETALTLIVAVALALLAKTLLARATAARAPDGRTLAPVGGWTDLERRFATEAAVADPVAHAASLMVGTTAWKNCVAVGAAEAGLHLAVKVPLLGAFGRKPVLIPWDEIVETGPARLWWGPARHLVVGRPTLATVTLPEAVFEAILARGHLAR
jgi:hypothetical protein